VVMVVMMVQSTREASIDKIGTVYVLQLQLCIWLQVLCHILFTFSSFVRFPDGILWFMWWNSRPPNYWRLYSGVRYAQNVPLN
jgi:hypothetical protein